MQLELAVEGVVDSLAVIKGNVIIGTAKVTTIIGIDQLYVRFQSGEIIESLRNSQQCVSSDYRFCPINGNYRGHDDLIENTAGPILKDVRVVDHFRLKFGIVPETFKEVQDYAIALKQENARKGQVVNMSGFYFNPSQCEDLKELSLHERLTIFKHRGELLLINPEDLCAISKDQEIELVQQLNEFLIPTHRYQDAVIPRFGYVPRNLNIIE